MSSWGTPAWLCRPYIIPGTLLGSTAPGYVIPYPRVSQALIFTGTPVSSIRSIRAEAKGITKP